MALQRRTLLKMAVAPALAVSLNATAAEEGKSTERPMRRSDRALDEKHILEAIRRTDHAVLSTADKTGTPYGIAITPIYQDGYIYFHSSAAGGRKDDNMLQNPKVSVIWIAHDHTDPKLYAVDYVSVIAAGTVSKVTDEAERKRIMLDICKRHATGVPPEDHLKKYNAGAKAIEIWKIKVDKLTGKSRNPEHFFGAEK